MGEYKVHAIFTSVLVALEVLFEILIPLIMAQIVNVGMVEDATSFTFTLQLGSKGFELFTMNNRVWFIVTCGAMMIVMALISLFFGTMSGRLAATASTGFAKNLRKKMFYKIENFSFANLDRFKTASLVTRLTTDVTNIQMAFQIIIRMLVRSPIMLILAMCMSISISPDLSLIFAAAIPVLIVGLIVGVKVVFPRFEKMLRKYDDMNESTQENLIGIRAVKAFVREDNEIDKFKKVSSTVQKLQFSAEKIIVIAFPFMQIVIYACMICVAWFGGNDIIVGNMKLGDFTAFLSYIMQILMSLIMVAMGFMNIVLSRASLDRIVEILDEKIDIEDAPDSQDIEVKDGSIDFDNVDFSYSKSRDVLNLENIDLHIRSGETIGIIGGTGSAKSTLVQLIPRLYDVLDGEVKVGGINVKDYKLDKLRDSVAMVLQKNVLFSGTIRQNLLWGNKDAGNRIRCKSGASARLHYVFPRRLRNRTRSGRRQRIRRSKTTSLHRARFAQKAENHDYGRFYVRSRYRNRRGNKIRTQKRIRRYYGAYHRSTYLFRRGRGQNHRYERRQNRRRWHSRRVACNQRDLSGRVQFPKERKRRGGERQCVKTKNKTSKKRRLKTSLGQRTLCKP